MAPVQNTILAFNGTGPAISIGGGEAWGSRITVTAGFQQGSTQITVQSASSITAGDLIVISQKNPSYATLTGDDGLLSWGGAPGSDGSGNDTTRNEMQVDLVTGVSGNVLTLERPLYISFSNTPVINVMTSSNYTYQAGVENLTIQSSGSGADEATINIDGTSECWLNGVRSILSNGTENYAHIMVADTYALEVRKCYLQGGGVNGSGLDYGVYLTNNTSECLVEDSIAYGLRHSWILAAGASGNVIGYNYSLYNWESDDGDPDDDLACHGGEPVMNLFESNYGDTVHFDTTWGGDAFNVVFRNTLLGYSHQDSSVQQTAIIVDSLSYKDNVVGNVVPGLTDDSGTYLLYNLVNGSISGSTAALPASLYYTSKPSWWTAALAWPIIGPDLTPTVKVIPAQARYNAGQEWRGKAYFAHEVRKFWRKYLAVGWE